MRRTALCCIALALSATTQAAATPPKPKPMPSCASFTDPRGDAGFLVLTDQSVDILGGGIATSRTELVARLDLASTRSTGQWDALGASWDLAAVFGGVDYTFSRSVAAGRPATTVRVGSTSPRFTFAVEGNSFVWRVKRSDVPSMNKKPGQDWVEIHAETTIGDMRTDSATGRSGCVRTGTRT